MLKGLTQPYSPSGRSALVPPPPWHYAGRVLSLEIEVDTAASQDFLPQGFGVSTGRAFGHFCDWQATTDGWELVDPVYAQYREFFLLLEAEQNGTLRLYCPFIYVDQDISMMRGLMQGWPKKIGSIWMTRSYDLDHPAAARRQAGTRLGASLAVKDRRLAECDVTLNGEEGKQLGFLSIPTFGLIGAPTIIGEPDPGPKRLVRQAVSSSVLGRFHAASGDLRFFPSPRDELGDLNPLRTVDVSIGEFALTVTGATESQ